MERGGNWNQSVGHPWPMPTVPDVENASRKNGEMLEMQASVWITIGLALLLVTLRIYYQIFRGRRRLWSDDYFLIAALLFLLGNGIALCEWVPHKVEPNVTTTASRSMVLAGSLMGLFNSFALACSKTSLGISFMRLTRGWWKSGLGISIFVIDILFVVQAWSYWVADCDGPAEPYRMQSSTEQGCITFKGVTYFRVTVQLLSCALDAYFTALPWMIVRPLKLKKFEKIGLGIAMSFGCASLACGIGRMIVLAFLAKEPYDHQPYYSVGGFLLNYFEPGLSIMAACMPVIRKLFMDVIQWKKGASTLNYALYRRKKKAPPAVLPVSESPGGSALKDKKGTSNKTGTTLVATSTPPMPTPPCDSPIYSPGISKKLDDLARWG
ncbi:hypothetical protein F5Y09DRAFT_350561 [Xylaria sp. FL1042]|nr:hypothetical protein F5Y09DRAFT_350561 [Xylaria sp. FL1042]